MRHVTEIEMIKEAFHGNVNAFGLLVGRYSNAVYATSYQIVRDFHQAQDIAQETFIRAWNNIGQIKEGEKFGSCTIS